MRRFIISFWFIALSAAACALILPGRALARPADVSVNVGIKPWWSDVAQPLSNVDINIKQVDVPYVFPIQGKPYFTNHLVSNDDVPTAPTAKSYDINTSNGFMQNLPWLGGTFRSITWTNFAWCGTDYYPGPPSYPAPGDFKMDFTVTPTAPPSPYGGYWKYIWAWNTVYFGPIVASGDSNTARAPANNDNTTTVGFTFIENPPPKGSITISKYEGKKEQNPPLATSSAVTGVQVDISNKPSIYNGSTWWRIPASWNRYTVPGVLVENSDYRLSFSVPTGYKLGNTSGLFQGTVCTGLEFTGYCTVATAMGRPGIPMVLAIRFLLQGFMLTLEMFIVTNSGLAALVVIIPISIYHLAID